MTSSCMFACVVAALALAACRSDQVGTDDLLEEAQAIFGKLPADFGEADHPTSPERVALGRTLFFDPRWSVDQDVSCATCHSPSLHGSDGLKKSIGVDGQQHVRNSPTVLNIAGDFATNWRGELKNVEEQAIHAAIGRFSTGHSDHAAWIAQIEAIPGYLTLFQSAFPDESNPSHQPISASRSVPTSARS